MVPHTFFTTLHLLYLGALRTAMRFLRGKREKGNTKLPFFQEGWGIRLQDQIDYGMNRGKRLGLSDLKEYISHFFNPKSNKTKTCDRSHLELHVYNSEVV